MTVLYRKWTELNRMYTSTNIFDILQLKIKFGKSVITKEHSDHSTQLAKPNLKSIPNSSNTLGTVIPRLNSWRHLVLGFTIPDHNITYDRSEVLTVVPRSSMMWPTQFARQVSIYCIIYVWHHMPEDGNHVYLILPVTNDVHKIKHM